MKSILFLFLLIPLSCFSQCLRFDYTNTETNTKVIGYDTGGSSKRLLASDNINTGFGNKAYLWCTYANSPEGDICLLTLIMTTDIKVLCFPKNTGKATLFFEDNTTLILNQLSPDLCNNDNARIIYGFNPDELEKLKNVSIIKIQAETTKGPYEFKIRQKKKEILKKTFALVQQHVKDK